MKNLNTTLEIWNILVDKALKGEGKMTYGELAKLVDGAIAVSISRQFLYIIMDYCKDKGLPPLTCLVVNKATEKPGAGLTTTEDYDSDLESVYNYKWDEYKKITVADLAPFKK